MPPSRLHPDQGAARVGRLHRQGPACQGLRPGPAGRGGRRLRGDGRPARCGRQADVDRPQDPHRQEQGDLDRRPRPPRRRRQDQGEPGGRGRQPGRRRRAGPQCHRRHHRHRIASQIVAGPDTRRQADPDQRRRPQGRHAAEGHRHRRRGRRRRRVRQHVRRRRGQGDPARVPPPDRPARGRRTSARSSSAASPSAASPS